MKRLFYILLLVLAPHSASADFAHDLAVAAEGRSLHIVRYDPSYRAMSYPMGGVPSDTGVCTDVVIRAYRAVGLDLQQLVHEDMKRAFGRYPKIWGLSRTDSNIDHRRVPNLEAFLTRAGASLAITQDQGTYLPGDIVSWRLPDGRPHIGIVTTKIATNGNPLIAHNIGWGPKVEDMLFIFDIHGHFRFSGLN